MADGCRICGLEQERDGLCPGHREEWIRWAALRPTWQNEAGYEAWIGSRVYDINAPALKRVAEEIRREAGFGG